MRPMRLGKRAVTDPAQIRAIIEACQVLHLGVVDAEGMFIVPVNFGYVWEADQALPCFYLHSAREGRKADAFYAGGDRGVPVAFELDCDRGNIVGDYSCAYSRSYASIMGNGTIRAVEDETERRCALERIMEHAAPGSTASFSPEGLARVAIFRLDANELTAKERRPKENREP